MKNIIKHIALLLVFITTKSIAQTPLTITKPEPPGTSYVVTATTGNVTLVASQSITLGPGTSIYAGSTFVASISPAAYIPITLSNENYIFTRSFQTPLVSPDDIINNSDVAEVVTYFDGLGRPIQSIGIKASPGKKDIVTHIAYDNVGRQDKDYLPYPDLTGVLGSYKTAADMGTNNYYLANYPDDINNLAPNPFSKKEFENAPLSRVLQQAAPGNDWALANNHTIKLEYQTNGANEVKLFNISQEKATGQYKLTLDSSTYFAANQLYKTITKDENWTSGKNNTTEEFKNKEGQIILKRTYSDYKNQTPTLSEVAHDTYYVYDMHGNLTYVLPPLIADQSNFIATTPIVTNTVSGTTIVNQNVTFCGYDDFSKIIDRSVFTGSSVAGGGYITVAITNNVLSVSGTAGFASCTLSNSPQTLSTKLQGTTKLLPNLSLGSVNANGYTASIINGNFVLSGYNSTTSLSINYSVALPQTGCTTVSVPTTVNSYTSELPADQNVLDNLAYQYKYDYRNRLIEKKLPGKGWEFIVYDKLDRPVLTQDANLRKDKKWLFTKYDAFSRSAYTGEYTNTLKTTRVDIQELADASTSVFETRQAAQVINGTTIYYSNTAFPAINDANINLFTINYYDDYSFDALPAGISTVSYGITPITNAKGLPTGSKVRILGKTNWITTWSYYDDKGRPICSYGKNDYLATTDIVKSQLDFVGKTLETTSIHSRNSLTTNIQDFFTYDQAGRLTKQGQSINGTLPEIISANTYDELGQLITKKVGGKTAQGLQAVNYKYNIRGWLKKINDVNTIATDLFAFQINYNDIADTTKKLFNGNISQTFWKTANTDATIKNYTYSYDNLNRLTSAADNLAKFNESLNYDKNGNITKLVRFGEIVSGVPYITNPTDFGIMDNLTYSYDAGNKLQIVSDSAYDSYGFKDDQIGMTADISTDYTYDANGNMKTDTNKGITAIEYNHLNLPTQITIGGQNIKYEYDATGVKQQKTANGIITDYAGGFIYEDNLLKFFSQPEGYVTYNSGTFDYIYQYKDHLGNVRLSYDKNLNIIEENNYYPFGLKQKGYNNVTAISTGYVTAQKYKYNGKELQDELGLNMYDYGARNYDPALGRWMNMDNHAGSYTSYSPYNYCINNPTNVIDPDGNDIYILIWATDRKNGKYGHAGIAVDNYKQQNKKDSQGNNVLDENGNAVTEMVKDGTYTYYDLWPGIDNDGDGTGDDFGSAEPNLRDSFVGMPAYYQNRKLNNLNGDPSNAEGYSPDGIIKLNAGYDETMETVEDLDSYMASNKNYKSALNNCSNFALEATLEALDKMGAFTSRAATESYLGGYTNIVTPNQLYKYLQKIVSSNPTEGRVVKSPGKKVDEKFTSNKEIKGN